MLHEADFCGDRLRLEAFLRVVDDGLPERPTRFRRRLRAAEDDGEGSKCRESDGTDSVVGPSRQDKFVNEGTVFDMVSLTRSEQLLYVPEEPLPNAANDDGCQGIREQSERAHPSHRVRVDENEAGTTVTKSSIKTSKTSSTRKRRRLHVNDLTLVRTVSSTGLPQLSDADQGFAAPAAVVDSIEDVEIVSSAFARPSSRPLATHRVQKMEKQVSRSKAVIFSGKQPSWALQRHVLQTQPASSNGARCNKIVRSSFATGSDGFVGAELDLQHTRKPNRLRLNNRARVQRVATASAKLLLANGNLPAPAVDHHMAANLPDTDLVPHVEDRVISHIPIRTYERPVLSQRALSEIHKAISAKEAREYRKHHLQKHESVVCHQLSSITAPTRHHSENSSSKSRSEACTTSNASESDNDDVCHGTQSLCTTPSARLPSFEEGTRYFESAMYNLEAIDRPNSVDFGSWSQHAELERPWARLENLMEGR